MIHGIDGDGGYSPIESIELDKHFKYVKENENKFWIGTFKDISKYILEANSLVIEENKNEEGNIIIDVTCEYTTKITELNYPVTILRKFNLGCKKQIVLNKKNLKEINHRYDSNGIIFDVIPGEKYLLKCDE